MTGTTLALLSLCLALLSHAVVHADKDDADGPNPAQGVIGMAVGGGQPTVQDLHVPKQAVVGSGRLTRSSLDHYDATLYASHGKWEPNYPAALTFDYLSPFKGKEIARNAADEIARLGQVDKAKLALWLGQMEQLIPDVGKSSQLTVVRDNEGGTLFYLGDKHLGTIEDPIFTKLFLGIWLDARTQMPDLRTKLLGLPAN